MSDFLNGIFFGFDRLLSEINLLLLVFLIHDFLLSIFLLLELLLSVFVLLFKDLFNYIPKDDTILVFYHMCFLFVQDKMLERHGSFVCHLHKDSLLL